MVGGRNDLLAVSGLVLGAAALRLGPLGPSSLWFDDAWVGLAVRAATPFEVALTGLTSPGFAFLLATVAAPFGTSTLAAQLLPFAAGVAAPFAGWWLARSLGLGRGPALLVGTLLVVSPVLVTYSTRVKPYSIEALLALGILALGFSTLARPSSRRRWAVLAGLCIVATVVSSVLALVGAAALAAGLLQYFQGTSEDTAASAGPPLVASGAVTAFWAGWYLLWLRPRITQDLREFWAAHYLVTDQGSGAFVLSLHDVTAGFALSLSGLPPALVLIALAGGAVAAVRRGLPAALLLFGPLSGAVVLAGWGLAPLGGGRTDAYLLPGAALAIGLALTAIPGRRGLAVCAVALLLVLLPARPAEPYPQHDLREVVRELEDRRRPGEPVLVQHHSRFGYGLYTPVPVRIVGDPESWQGFTVEPDDPDVVLLPYPSARLRWDVLRAASEAPALWVVESHMSFDPWMSGVIADALDEAGFASHASWEVDGARLTAWRPTPGSAPWFEGGTQ